MYVVYVRVELVWPHLDSAAGWTRGALHFSCHTSCVCCCEAQIKLTLAVFKLFLNNPPPAGLHLALGSSCVDSSTHPSLLWDRPTPSLPAPHPHLRIGCPALRPCAEEVLAGSSMGAVLAGIPTTPSTTDLPPPRCPTETGTPPSPADGRRH